MFLPAESKAALRKLDAMADMLWGATGS